MIERELARRDEAFLQTLAERVYAIPASPYRRLLANASVELGDIERLVKESGIEATLSRLYDAGVYVTQNEFKARAPIQRNGLEFVVDPEDFDVDTGGTTFRSRTSGTTGGGGVSVTIDLEGLGRDSASTLNFVVAQGRLGAPVAVWMPAPPNSSGLNNMVRYTKSGMPPERWFSQSRLPSIGEDSGALFRTRALSVAGRLAGVGLPQPVYLPPSQALIAARWAAGKVAAGKPPLISVNASNGARLCDAAATHGLNIEGTLFSMSGEPYTEGKARHVEAVGAHAVSAYAMVETGRIGFGCADMRVLDDTHLSSEKLALIQREKPMGDSGLSVDVFVFSTIQPTRSKVLLNVESGDFGKVEERECGCLLGEMGLKTHISSIRAYDKLTSEGVTFIGAGLFRLIENVLPARFGGHPTDYQLVEEEGEDGLPRVSLIVSPVVGEVADAAVLETVFQFLEESRAGAAMAQHWRQSGTLRVQRRETFTGRSGKILPLHVVHNARRS
jgi:hypothetical protein